MITFYKLEEICNDFVNKQVLKARYSETCIPLTYTGNSDILE